MKKSRLDKIDRNILSRLQCDGRVTNVELAKSVGISAPPCLRRVRALEQNGFIKEYHAVIDSNKMGYGVTVFAMVKLKGQTEDELNKFEKHIETLSMVRESYMLAGDVDYVLKIVAKDWDAYQDLLTHQLTTAPSVESVKSSLTMKCVKNEPGIPIE